MKNRERVILDALAKRREEPRNGPVRAWIFAEELRVSVGWMPIYEGVVDPAIKLGHEQRIDAFAFHTWPSKGYRRVAYEVKTSRADLKRELANPDKCAAALALSNLFYLVMDDSFNIEDLDLPDEWGVMRLVSGRRLRIVRRAPFRYTPIPPYSFMLSVARNLQARNDLDSPAWPEAPPSTSATSAGSNSERRT